MGDAELEVGIMTAKIKNRPQAKQQMIGFGWESIAAPAYGRLGERWMYPEVMKPAP
jgi:hypothetical protein